MMNNSHALLTLAATALLVFAASSYAQNIDCRSCHISGSMTGAMDFSDIYARVKAHHPVDVAYPDSANKDFHQPSGNDAGVAFFDKNSNGLLGSDEVQLYKVNGVTSITCSSCHAEHGNQPLAVAPHSSYLRVTTAKNALCATCHNQ